MSIRTAFTKVPLFAKVFAYTAVFLVVIIVSAVGLFYQQFSALLRAHQLQQLRVNYQVLLNDLPGLDTTHMIATAQQFADANQTFNFRLIGGDGQVVFDSPPAGLNVFSLGELPPSPVVMVGETSDFHLPVGQFPVPRRLLLNASEHQNLTFQVGPYTLVAQAPVTAITAGAVMAQFGWMFALLLGISLVFAYVFARQLARENTKRRQMEQHQAYFFSAASHELKTPIAGARLMMEGMLLGMGDYQNHDKYLKQCIQLMDVQSHTIQEILEIVKLDGHYELSPQHIDIRQLVSELHTLYTPLLSEKQLQLDIHLPPLQLTTDAGLFKKVLSNVLLNAIQNTAPGQSIRVYTDMAPTGTRLCLMNPGHMDETTLSHVFDSFYRGDTARSSGQGQTGLGLTIVAKALKLLHHKYGLENTDAGVCFWIML